MCFYSSHHLPLPPQPDDAIEPGGLMKLMGHAKLFCTGGHAFLRAAFAEAEEGGVMNENTKKN